MKVFIGIATLLSTIVSSSAFAAPGERTAVVTAVQAESATRVGYENLMYVLQTGSWNGSPNCLGTWAYFNAAENPYFAAMVLSARTHGTSLRIQVDDALPKVSGICQIINIQY